MSGKIKGLTDKMCEILCDFKKRVVVYFSLLSADQIRIILSYITVILNLVELGGVEPPSEIPLPSALHV